MSGLVGQAMRELRLAEGAIESLALGMVAKSGESLSEDQAVARALRTPEGARAYDRYVAAQDRARQAVYKAEAGLGPRDPEEVAREFNAAVVHAVEAGEPLESAVRRFLTPEVAQACGLTGAVVSKSASPSAGTDAVWERIESLADAMVTKSGDGLSHERAVDQVLKSAEGQRLYEEHQRAFYAEASF